MVKLTLQVIARMGTRSTSYNVKDMERALLQVGLTPVRNSFVFVAEQTYANKENAITDRKKIEAAIKRVHRNAVYRLNYS